MVNKKYTAAVIGLGRIGFDFQFDSKREQPASHTKAFSSCKRIDLIAGVDTDASRRALFAKTYPRCAVFADCQEMFRQCKPDIVSVSVSEESHLVVAKNVITFQPKLVVLEKPVALNIADAKSIADHAKKYETPVLVNHNRRFADDYRLTKQLIDNGLLGEVQSCYAKLFAGSVIYSKQRFLTGECSLLHDGTHLLDILRYLFGSHFSQPHVNAVKLDDKKQVRFVSLTYQLDNKTIFAEISGEKKFFGFELDILGSKGRIVIGNGYYKVYTAKQSPFYDNFVSLVRENKFKPFKKTNYFANMATNCVDFLDGKAKLISTLDDGVGVIEDLTAIADLLKIKCRG